MEKSKDKRSSFQKLIGNSIAGLMMIAIVLGTLYAIGFFAKKLVGLF